MKTIVLIFIAILHTITPTVKNDPQIEKYTVIINGEEKNVSLRFIEQCQDAINALMPILQIKKNNLGD